MVYKQMVNLKFAPGGAYYREACERFSNYDETQINYSTSEESSDYDSDREHEPSIQVQNIGLQTRLRNRHPTTYEQELREAGTNIPKAVRLFQNSSKLKSFSGMYKLLKSGELLETLKFAWNKTPLWKAEQRARQLQYVCRDSTCMPLGSAKPGEEIFYTLDSCNTKCEEPRQKRQRGNSYEIASRSNS
jgi:hypothetical protein